MRGLPRSPLGTLCAVLCTLAAALVASGNQATRRPDVVFILLDTTRADRLSAWGNQRETTPSLDALARSGIRFARHFANSHATRPSMPQLMSGRYYQSNILREFRPGTHPRDWPFAVPDPTMALLPELLDRAGYHLLAVTAHPWVAGASRLGAPFDIFDEPPAPAGRGHPDANVIVDRALALWRGRPHDRPNFLYLHLMDAHIPRYAEPGTLRFGEEDPIARGRFDAAGEPTMDDPGHDWDRSDARAFTTGDIAFFTAVYDTMLARMDEELGRLLAAVRHDDPGLRHTLVVVTADHGEELGEHGRISHEPSLDDAVQHVPWIVAGGDVAPAQTAWGVTEHVDVVPTLLQLIGVAPPSAIRFDGRSVVADGHICTSCLRPAPVFAWEDYRGVRLGRRLLRAERTDSFAARCLGPHQLLGRQRRIRLSDPDATSAAVRFLSRSLDRPASTFIATRYTAPATRVFSVLPPFWGVAGAPVVTCLPVGPETPRSAFAISGWIWTGRGVLVMEDAPRTPPLHLVLDVPNGTYEIQLGVRSVPAPPRFFGYHRWLRKRLRRRQPEEHLSLGHGTAVQNQLRIEVPGTMAERRHIVSVRLLPSERGDERPNASRDDAALRERLRRLGYLE